MPAPPAGYSGTPLVQKLGVKPGQRVLVIDPPKGYRSLLQPLPEKAKIVTAAKPPLAFVHLFTTRRADLESRLPALLEQLEPAGVIWVSWPKKTSGVETDITEDTIREVALSLGLVDIKVCAVDATWSGLKLVIRKEKRT
jgi:hypothetical protein